MLVSETAKINWSTSNKNYYESKGYIFTKWRDEFEVKVKDLSKGCHTYVKVQCDICKKINDVIWGNYMKSKNNCNIDYCKNCKKEKELSTRLKNGKSFYNWCIENNREDLLERWDYELNKCNPEDILYRTRVKRWFKCPRDIHPSELKLIDSIVGEGSSDCKQCNSFAQWGIDNICEDFLEKYWDYDKNTIDPWDINFQANKKVLIYCQEKDYHESYSPRCSDFINGSRCPYCKNQKIHPLDSLGAILEDKFLLGIWSDKNKKSPHAYSPKSPKEVWWKCLEGKHEDYKRKINDSNRYEFRCPECSREKHESILQEKVRIYLESLGYIILHEEKCSIVPQNPKYKGSRGQMPFDNEIKELKLIIEVNGIQHYRITNFHNLSAKKFNTTPEKELYFQKVRDRYKKFIAYKYGYEYIEIPYWLDDEDETYKKLINYKINKIIQRE